MIMCFDNKTYLLRTHTVCTSSIPKVHMTHPLVNILNVDLFVLRKFSPFLTSITLNPFFLFRRRRCFSFGIVGILVASFCQSRHHIFVAPLCCIRSS